MSYFLFLDDARDPRSVEYGNIPGKRDYFENLLTFLKRPVSDCIVAKNYHEFISIIEERGLPWGISFDHDLGDFYEKDGERKERTGKTCAEWLCNYCMDTKMDLPLWFIHTNNPSGGKNIESYLRNFARVRD